MKTFHIFASSVMAVSIVAAHLAYVWLVGEMKRVGFQITCDGCYLNVFSNLQQFHRFRHQCDRRCENAYLVMKTAWLTGLVGFLLDIIIRIF